MIRSRLDQADAGPYGHLIQRLAFALEEVDTATRLRAEPPAELELSGLSAAELALISAYLEGDLPWLSGWHAAAVELAQIERRALNTEVPSKVSGKTIERRSPLTRKRQPLCCALCGTASDWQHGQGALACKLCGSQLFRAGNSR